MRTNGRPPLAPSSTMAALLIVGLLGLGQVEAAEIERGGLYRTATAKLYPMITPAPEIIPELRRRAQTDCPVSYSLCPQSLNGGCCADGYACGSMSCEATSKAPQSCGGTVGMFACPPDKGNGCCPEGTQCGIVGCLPMDGVSQSHSCSASMFLCPASLGYGCCSNGMACGTNRCYSTEPSTFTFTKTTTDKNDNTVTTTITTTSTPSEPTDTTADAAHTELNKVYPTFIAKVDPIITKTKNGGLTTAQLVGIVVGVVALLVIVVAVAIFTTKRVNKLMKAVEKTNESQSSETAGRQPMKEGFTSSTYSDSVMASREPLMRSPHPSHRRGDSSGADTPLGWSSQSPDVSTGTRPTPSGFHNSGGYEPVPTSGGNKKKGSVDSTSSYFDALPVRNGRSSSQSGNLPPNRTSSDSQGTYAIGGRMRSNTNETTSDLLSSGQQSPVELDTAPYYAELPAEAFATGGISRPPLTHQRSPSGGSTHGRNGSAAGMGTPALDAVAEAVEHHGHYGPSDRTVGQTGANYPSPSL